MYSYIYADSRGNINYAVGAKTKAGIERLAIDNIANMIHGQYGYNKTKQPVAKEIQDVFDACDSKNADKAIEAWNTYATSILKQSIACHKIAPFNIVE